MVKDWLMMVVDDAYFMVSGSPIMVIQWCYESMVNLASTIGSNSTWMASQWLIGD